MIRNLTLSLNLKDVTTELVQDIKTTVESSPGKVELRIKVLDDEEKIQTDLFSRKYRIAIDKQLLNFVEGCGIEYSVK